MILVDWPISDLDHNIIQLYLCLLRPAVHRKINATARRARLGAEIALVRVPLVRRLVAIEVRNSGIPARARIYTWVGDIKVAVVSAAGRAVEAVIVVERIIGPRARTDALAQYQLLRASQRRWADLCRKGEAPTIGRTSVSGSERAAGRINGPARGRAIAVLEAAVDDTRTRRAAGARAARRWRITTVQSAKLSLLVYLIRQWI